MSDASQRLVDESEIRRIRRLWAFARDQGDWNTVASLFHPNAPVAISWYNGNAEGFVENSRRMFGHNKPETRSKHWFGNDRLMLSRDLKTGMKHNNVVQATIGRGEAKLRAVRAYLFSTLAEVWSEIEAGRPLTTDHRLALRLASTWTIHQSAEVVDAAYHMAGATAIFHAQAFERRFRDIHAIAQQIQARDIHYES